LVGENLVNLRDPAAIWVHEGNYQGESLRENLPRFQVYAFLVRCFAAVLTHVTTILVLDN
jgi:hypothetical protein